MVYKKWMFKLRSFTHSHLNTHYGYTSSLLEMLSIAFKANMHSPLEVLQHRLACFCSDASHFFCNVVLQLTNSLWSCDIHFVI